MVGVGTAMQPFTMPGMAPGMPLPGAPMLVPVPPGGLPTLRLGRSGGRVA